MESDTFTADSVVPREINNLFKNLSEFKMQQLLREYEKLADVPKEKLLEEFLTRRKKQLLDLKLLQQEINNVINCNNNNNKNSNVTDNDGNDVELIVIENEVDLDVPEKFRYIEDYIFSRSVKILNEPLLGCSCDENVGCYTENCCPYLNDSEPVYDETGVLIWDENIPIYECNDRCTCDKNCRNRVTQKSIRIKFSIFKTDDGRGWGVRTLQPICRGTYIGPYTGMIMTAKEATRKSVKNAQLRRYLFNLDYDNNEQGNIRKKNCTYTVDAYSQGNVTRFINHSCDPNLSVRCVWINCLDADFYKVCLFSKRDIEAQEELTFDYKYPVNATSSTVSGNVCKCKSANCRRIIF